MFDDNDIGIAFITETWLTSLSNPTIAELKKAGYSATHTIRKDDIRGGGTMVLFKNTLKSKQIHLGEYTSFEYTAVKMYVESSTIILISIYRLNYFPRTNNTVPLSLFLTEFQRLLEATFVISERMIISGDFNIHFELCNKIISEFTQLIKTFDLAQGVSGPTHTAGHTLDLVLFNETGSSVSNFDVVQYNLCVHACVFFDITTKIKREGIRARPQTFRKIKSINIEDFKCDLSNKIALEHIKLDTNCKLSTLVGSFNNNLRDVLDKHAPISHKKPIRTEYPKWFDGEFIDLRRTRRRAEKLWRSTSLEVHREMYVTLRTKVSNLSIIKRQKYLRNRIDNASNDSKELFKISHDLLGNSSNYVLPDIFNGDFEKISNGINDYFTNKIVTIRDEMCNIPTLGNFDFNIDNELDSEHIVEGKPLPFVTDSGSLLMNFTPTTASEIRSILKESGVKTGMLDPLPATLLRGSLDIIIPTLVDIVNCSLSSGDMDGLKDAVVRPLLKKSGLDPDDLKNYRPVTNLSFLSKLVERVVLTRLNAHLEANNLNIPNQSGYKKGHSCETLLLRITNDILIGIDKKNATVVLLLDLSAAFDTVDHQKLINILHNEIGIRGTCLKWFRSFIVGRSQRVKAGSSLSEDVELEFGVPQGSVLGPVLFNIYMRSLYRLVMSHGFNIHGYADDNQIYCTFNIDVQYNIMRVKIPKIFSIISTWMRSHFLKLNPSKSEIIIFHPASTSPYICVSRVYFTPDLNLTTQSTVHLLGMTLDSCLTYDNHVTSLMKSTYNHIRNVASVRKLLSIPHIKSLVNAIIMSKLDYCNSLLYGTSSYNLTRLQLLQNSAAKVIYGRRKRDRVSDILEELHWLRVDARIHFKILCIVYRCINGPSAPPYLTELIILKHPIPKLLAVPRTSTSHGDKAFSVSGPKLWNALPSTIRLCTSLQIFKNSLKTYFFKNFQNYIKEINKLRT